MAYLFGTETEFALTVGRCDGELRPGSQELAEAVVHAVAERQPHLPAPPPHKHLFLGNGAAVYPDVGGHPEAATAECDAPRELAGQELALRAMLAEATRAVAETYGIDVELVANNLDYAPEPHSFGHHINLLASRRLKTRQIECQLTPLLAALTVLAGTGRVSSVGFELSQRASFMCRIAGRRTTGRGLITTKDESLAGADWQRIHLISIDSPLSPSTMMLVPAILAMAVELLARGKDIGSKFALADPIRALRSISRNLSLKMPLELREGGTTTALEIMTAYRDAAGELEGGSSPGWVGQMIVLWSDILSSLASEPLSEYRLNWPVKLLLLTDVLVQEGMTWDQLVRWQAVIGPLRQVLAPRTDVCLTDLSGASAAEAILPRSVLGVLTPRMIDSGLKWQDLPTAARIIARVWESCLGFHVLEEHGGLYHRIASRLGLSNALSTEAVERAKTDPPANTRAVSRGAAIKTAEAGSLAWWTFVQTRTHRLDLTDPLQVQAEWTQRPQQSSTPTPETAGARS